ncbi:hypothetical protein BC628DRAFT_511005 [Trametes gibbosa]|nr:hypothetical protein BC628DRAFT_511005 [Trametes gibbosa]
MLERLEYKWDWRSLPEVYGHEEVETCDMLESPCFLWHMHRVSPYAAHDKQCNEHRLTLEPSAIARRKSEEAQTHEQGTKPGTTGMRGSEQSQADFELSGGQARRGSSGHTARVLSERRTHPCPTTRLHHEQGRSVPLTYPEYAARGIRLTCPRGDSTPCMSTQTTHSPHRMVLTIPSLECFAELA